MDKSTQTNPSRADDPEFLEQFRSEDASTFQRAIRPLLPALLNLSRRLTQDPHWAEDLVQETLIRAFQHRSSFRGESSLRSWLFRIQIRLASQPQRWKRPERAQSLTDLEIPDALATDPTRTSQERELQQRLDEAMERLSLPQRTALHLRAVEGLDYQTIAAITGRSIGASRGLVLVARQKIMDRMGRHLSP